MSNRDGDLAAMDHGPLRGEELQAIRLLLELERSRARARRRLLHYLKWLGVGVPALVAIQQTGLVDFLAGLIVRMRGH